MRRTRVASLILALMMVLVLLVPATAHAGVVSWYDGYVSTRMFAQSTWSVPSGGRNITVYHYQDTWTTLNRGTTVYVNRVYWWGTSRVASFYVAPWERSRALSCSLPQGTYRLEFQLNNWSRPYNFVHFFGRVDVP